MRHRPVVEVLLLWLVLLAGCGAVANQMAPGATIATPAASPVAQRTGDPQRGAALFAGDVAIANFVACRGCHSVDPTAGDGLGPNLAGIALRAGSRIPGVAADEYVRGSILVHDDFVVPGFEAGLVRAVVGRDFGEILSDQDIADLTAYLLTLDQALIAQAPALDPSPSPTLPPEPTTVAVAPTETALPAPTTAATMSSLLTRTVEPSPATSPSPDNRTSGAGSPTIAATATQSAPDASASTASSPTIPPSPTDAATPIPAPTPTQPPPPATTNPPASETDGSLPPELAIYTGCMTCHDQHAQSVVKMPHVRFPQCSACHSGSPSRVGCPTCHSMHRIQAPHGGENPNLPCSHCHADR